MDDFEKELKLGFLEESTQHLGDTEQCFLELESRPDDKSIIEKIFRLAHNLKGSSKAVGFAELGAFTHEFESFLLKIKNGLIPIDKASVNLLLRSNDHVKLFVEALKMDLSCVLPDGGLVEEMQKFVPGAGAPAAAPAATAAPAAPEPAAGVVAVATATMPAAEAAPVAAATAQDVSVNAPARLPSAPAAPKAAPTAANAEESIRVSLPRLEKLVNFVGELVIHQTVLREQALHPNPQLLRRTIHQMSKVTKEIQDLSMSLRMVPLKQTFQKMQRIVRDTSSLLGKEVQFEIAGEETEVDKTILEQISDPLVHLIRNAIDHGIEKPADRMLAGKNQAGHVKLHAYHQGGKLVIDIKDDGNGINGERLRKKAIEKGILTESTPMSEREAVNLVFHPGFSTKAEVTEVSGRGVGMDVVKTNIENLQGEVLIETVVGSGTTFKIILPLTLAIIEGMVVKLGSDRFVIPLAHVHESMKPAQNDMKKVTGYGEVLMLRGENLPAYRLSALLNRQRAPGAANEEIAIILRQNDQPFTVLVDDIIGQHQVVIKKLGAELQGLRGFSGSAILGDGKPALILELVDLVSKDSKRRSA